MESQSALLKTTARMVLAGLIIAIMVIGKSFLVPFTWSLLIALASIGLIDKVKDAGLPLKSIEQLQYEAVKICGKPAKPELGDEVVAAIKWVDGTVIDSVRKVIGR